MLNSVCPLRNQGEVSGEEELDGRPMRSKGPRLGWFDMQRQRI
jgi:hypothetical protein